MALLVVSVLLCLFGWVSLYFFLCNVNGSRGGEWNCRLVTLLHGILAVCITAYIGYVDGPWPFTYPGRMFIHFDSVLLTYNLICVFCVVIREH